MHAFAWIGCSKVFLETKELQPLLWHRYIDGIFFIWTQEKDGLKKLMEKFINFTPTLRFTYEASEKSISFLTS